jgi:hypothetical protein
LLKISSTEVFNFVDKKPSIYWRIGRKKNKAIAPDTPEPVAKKVAGAKSNDSNGEIKTSWDSVEVERKIDDTLKKTEAIASHFGEDIDSLLRNAVSSGTSGNESGETSLSSTSTISSAVSAHEYVQDLENTNEWSDVSKRIEDSLTVIERLANRLGVDPIEIQQEGSTDSPKYLL